MAQAKVPVGRLIASLKGAKAEKRYTSNITCLEKALKDAKQDRTEEIVKLINYFDNVLSNPYWTKQSTEDDQKVKEAIQLIGDKRAEIEKPQSSERGLITGLSGTNKQLTERSHQDASPASRVKLASRDTTGDNAVPKKEVDKIKEIANQKKGPKHQSNDKAPPNPRRMGEPSSRSNRSTPTNASKPPLSNNKAKAAAGTQSNPMSSQKEMKSTEDTGTTTSNELDEIKKEIEKFRRNDDVMTPDSLEKYDKPEWRKTLYLIGKNMSSKENRLSELTVELDNMKKGLSSLKEEFSNGNTQTTLPKELEEVKRTVEKKLSETPSKELTEIKRAIEKFQKHDDVNTAKGKGKSNENDWKATLSSVEQRLSNLDTEVVHFKEGLTMLKMDLESQKPVSVKKGGKEPEEVHEIRRMVATLKSDSSELSQLQIKIEELHKEHADEKDSVPTKGSKESVRMKDISWIANCLTQRKETISKLETELTDMKGGLTGLKTELESQQTVSVTRRDKEPNEIHEIRVVVATQMKSLKRENKQLQDEMEKVNRDFKQIKDEKDEYVLRLSKVAGAQLSNNNPNIADLSDPKRPTKVAEIYKEIYDNQWTEAYEVIEKEKDKTDERMICSLLVDLLFEAESYCMQIADLQKTSIIKNLFEPARLLVTAEEQVDTGHKEKVKPKQTEVDAVHSKTISDLRKQLAEKSVKDVVSCFKPSIETPKAKAVKEYADKCVETCWYMKLQSPPVVLAKLNKKETAFDKDKYKEYTKKGSKVDFVTWPPLLLHEGGALLSKGVAQGK